MFLFLVMKKRDLDVRAFLSPFYVDISYNKI
jgi:hypothetical protein